MKGRKLQPGKEWHYILPGNFKARLECRPDAAYLILGTEQSIIRTYKLLPLLVPPNCRQKLRPVTWLLIDSTGQKWNEGQRYILAGPSIGIWNGSIISGI